MLTTCVLALWTPLALGSEPSDAHDDDHVPPQHVVGLRGVVALHLLEDRASGLPGEEAPERDLLGGVVLSYEHLLIDERLSLQLAKPVLFGHGRYDSPFETSLKLMNRWGRFEPFIALGYTFNVRLFGAERKEIEGTSNSLSFGLLAGTGVAFWFADRTGLEVDVSYVHILAGPIVEGELTASVGLARAF